MRNKDTKETKEKQKIIGPVIIKEEVVKLLNQNLERIVGKAVEVFRPLSCEGEDIDNIRHSSEGRKFHVQTYSTLINQISSIFPHWGWVTETGEPVYYFENLGFKVGNPQLDFRPFVLEELTLKNEKSGNTEEYRIFADLFTGHEYLETGSDKYLELNELEGGIHHGFDAEKNPLVYAVCALLDEGQFIKAPEKGAIVRPVKKKRFLSKLSNIASKLLSERASFSLSGHYGRYDRKYDSKCEKTFFYFPLWEVPITNKRRARYFWDKKEYTADFTSQGAFFCESLTGRKVYSVLNNSFFDANKNGSIIINEITQNPSFWSLILFKKTPDKSYERNKELYFKFMSETKQFAERMRGFI